MHDIGNKILVWLASPMGDAILCTPALRTIHRHFKSCKITFLAEPVVHEVLSPSSLNDGWIVPQQRSPFAIAKMLKKHNFKQAILFKNSFASALAVFLAKIPLRIGYAREGRGFMLTDKLYPPRLSNGKFKPISMVDYYLAIACRLGADTIDRNLELLVDSNCSEELKGKLPEVVDTTGPVVIMVPGGAYGPSKCWPSERFAQTADRLIADYNATVVISVSPDPIERKIADEICKASRNKLISLSKRPLSICELKALFSIADLVLTNDTGPRHIAIALGRKVITLFGPNDPAWTDTGYQNEIQIVGNVPCAPCTKPVCRKSKHLCMQAITEEMVYDAAKELLEDNRGEAVVFAQQKFVQASNSLFVESEYKSAFNKLGLYSIDDIFLFNTGKNLVKNRLAKYRSRQQFEINFPPAILFLKRYEKPPTLFQLKNWLSHHSRKSCGIIEVKQINELAKAGINTPKIVSFGQQWGLLFEKRSFIITEKIPNAESLERRLPSFFSEPAQNRNLKLQRSFIDKLASFIKRFHQTCYRHRDLYFSHIFYGNNSTFYLIDLARAFKPILRRRRFRIKDIAQLHYSAPAKYFSNTDRLRFYLSYVGRHRLTNKDKIFIREVVHKARRMARHDIKHGKFVPFVG